MNIKLEKIIIYIISFFLYAGYYIGLLFFYSTGNVTMTRYYSVPLRFILFVLMFYFVVVKFNRLQSLNRSKSLNIIFFIFSAYYILKVLYTESIDANLGRSWGEYIFYYISSSVLPFLFFSTVDFYKYYKTILKGLILSGFILGILVIFTYKDILLTGGIDRISKLKYDTGEEALHSLAMAYSGALTILLCLYVFIYQKTSKAYRLYLILTFIVSLLIFFLGATRGALIAVLLGIFIFLYFGNTKKKILSLFIFAISIPIVFYALELTGSAIFERAQSTIDEGNTSGRDILWVDAYNEFLENPILGGRIEVSGIYPHNIFLEILMATGIIGMLLFLYIFVKSVRNGIIKIKKNHIYFVSMLIFICGISQGMVTGSIWLAKLFFASLGMFNSIIPKSLKELHTKNINNN